MNRSIARPVANKRHVVVAFVGRLLLIRGRHIRDHVTRKGNYTCAELAAPRAVHLSLKRAN